MFHTYEWNESSVKSLKFWYNKGSFFKQKNVPKTVSHVLYYNNLHIFASNWKLSLQSHGDLLSCYYLPMANSAIINNNSDTRKHLKAFRNVHAITIFNHKPQLRKQKPNKLHKNHIQWLGRRKKPPQTNYPINTATKKLTEENR